MARVEIPESLKGVGTGDVRVEDKEGRIVLAEDLTGESQGTGGTERFGLDAEGDGDTVLLLGLLEHGDHDLGSVVDSEDNVLDTGFNESLRECRSFVSTVGLYTPARKAYISDSHRFGAS